MTIKKKNLVVAIITALLVLVFGFIFVASKSPIGLKQEVRTIELSTQADYASILNDFDNSELKVDGSLTTFVGYQTLTLDLFEEFDNVSENDIQQAEGIQIKYDFSYNSETNIVTLSAKMVNGDAIEIEEIYGSAFINDLGNIDAVMYFDGEYALLSEMQDAGLIQNCGWFSNLFKRIVKAVVVVAAVVACVATAGAGIGAVIAVGAAVGATSNAVEQLVDKGSIDLKEVAICGALGAIPVGGTAIAGAKVAAKTATTQGVKNAVKTTVSNVADKAVKNLSSNSIQKLQKIGLTISNGAITNKKTVVNGVTSFLDNSGKVIAKTYTVKNSKGETVTYLMQTVDPTTVKVVGTIPEKGLQKAVGQFDNSGCLMENWQTVLKTERQNAVKQAWKEEQALVKSGHQGTRQWTRAELDELKRTGKVSGYEGHHINSALYNPEYAGLSKNIKFVKKSPTNEHLEYEHSGNYQNPTFGNFLNR